MAYTIYKLINKQTRRSYTGATSNLERRLGNHFTALKKGKHINSDMQQDFNKGHEFRSVVVKTLSTREEALIEEKRNIGKRSYNINCKYHFPKGFIKVGVLKIISTTPIIEKRVSEYYEMKPQRFQRWVRRNSSVLTVYPVLKVIREELNLTDDQILEETKKSVA